MGMTACTGAIDGRPVEDIPHDHVASYGFQQRRPRRLILIRHGQSEGNVVRDVTKHVPDHMLHLTAHGRKQALAGGVNLKSLVGNESINFIHSPYVRTQETLNGILRAFGGREKHDVSEDPFIREQDFGNFDGDDSTKLHQLKKLFGKFYFRFPEGESPADVYVRAGLFLESLYRRWESRYVENLVIVSHELFIVCFLIRLFRWPVEDYNRLEDIKNCELIILERGAGLKYDITSTWAPDGEKKMGGLARKTTVDAEAFAVKIWDGDPDAELLLSTYVR